MSFDKDVFARRREAFRKIMIREEVEAFLVTRDVNRYYLSGFELSDAQCNESSGMLLITSTGDDWLLTDPRYTEETKRHWDEDKVFIYSGADRLKKIRDFIKGRHVGVVGFEPTGMCFAMWHELTLALSMRPCMGLVEKLRLYKDPHEIELIRQSNALNHKVFKAVPELMQDGMPEKALAWELEKMFRENGAQELAFSTIVGVNENAALPHCTPGDTPITEECLVLVDMGCRLNDYNSDMTRTFWFGEKPSDRFLKVRDMVREAQDAALAVIRPGVDMKEPHLEALKVFERHDVAEYFTHGLGHGVGLETHEPPSLNKVAKNTLQPGMVVTVEPGLYWPEWGGVRWEYMALVTEDGHELL